MPDNAKTLDELRETYYEATSTLSGIVRQLSLAGLALIWLFSPGDKIDLESIEPPQKLKVAGFLIVLSLAFDLLQYIWRSLAFGNLARCLEKRGTAASTIPLWVNWVSISCIVAKTGLMLAAYLLLGLELTSQL